MRSPSPRPVVTSPNEVLLEVVAILERLGVPYYLGGSYASGMHGVPRSTRDADLVVEMSAAQAHDFTIALGTSYYADADMMTSSIKSGISFNIVHLSTQFKIDFYPVGTSRLRKSEMERRSRQPLGGREVFLATAEETLLAKLSWFREGGEVSDRQWGDIIGIIEVQGDRLDRVYLERWARDIGVADLLTVALDQSKPDES